jgi:hypothetical protein
LPAYVLSGPQHFFFWFLGPLYLSSSSVAITTTIVIIIVLIPCFFAHDKEVTSSALLIATGNQYFGVLYADPAGKAPAVRWSRALIPASK